MGTSRGLVEIPTDALDTTGNVREDLGDLTELTRSVAELGVVTPVTVYRQPDGRWVVLAGHRRVEASRRAGLATVPALSLGTAPPDADQLVVALVENLLREGLNPLDEAVGYQQLADLTGWRDRAIAAALHVAHTRVFRRRSLLSLPPAVQAMIRGGGVTMEHGYELVRLVKDGADATQVTKLANKPRTAATQELRRRQQRRLIAEETQRLEAAGLTVVDDKDLPHQRTLVALDIDPAEHHSEPCHVVALRPTRSKAPLAVPGCVDPDSHPPVPDYTPEQDAAETVEYRARFAEYRAQRDARSVELGRRLAADDPDTIIWEALAVSAHMILGVPPHDDPLLASHDLDDRDPVVCPPAAIRAATAHHLAAAIVRHHLEHQDRTHALWGPVGDSVHAILNGIEHRIGPLDASSLPAAP